MDDLVARMYQAAADERLWLPLLRTLERRLQARASWFLMFQGDGCLGAWATGGLRDVADTALAQCHDWTANPQLAYSVRSPSKRFVLRERYFPAPVLAEDPVAQRLRHAGLENQVGATLRLPQGVAVLGVARAPGVAFCPAEIAELNRLHGHWAHATHLAVRLLRAHAHHASHVLQHLGHAAAVLTRRGAVVVCNALFEHSLRRWAWLDAANRLQPHWPEVGRYLIDELHHAGARSPTALLHPLNETTALALRLLPLWGGGREAMSGGDVLLVAQWRATGESAGAAPQALQERYEMSAKEAQLACLLADGVDLRQIAQRLNLSYVSARTYLDRVYEKTGTHRQAELVRLVLRHNLA